MLPRRWFDPRTEKRPACAMVRRSLLRAAVVAACVAPGAADLTITITSPVAGHVYHTGVVFPSAHVVAGPGPLSDAVLAAPGDFAIRAGGAHAAPSFFLCGACCTAERTVQRLQRGRFTIAVTGLSGRPLYSRSKRKFCADVSKYATR